MASSSSQLLVCTALVLTVALPDISAFHYPTQSRDLGHQSSPSLAISASSSPRSGSYPELRPGALTLTGSKTSLRAKRISQMSCHCCSNSFNSHCCLKCMQRVGKRTSIFKLPHKESVLPSFDPLEDVVFLPSDGDQAGDSSLQNLQTSGSYDDAIAVDEPEPFPNACLCCLSQIREGSEISASLSCCSSCFRKRQ